MCCLIFLLPILVVYEIGILWLGGTNPEELRNGADYWMRAWLQQQGYRMPWLLPFLVIVSLLTYQILGRFPWHFRFETLIGMAAESVLFACVLLLLARGQDWLFRIYFNPADLELSGTTIDRDGLVRIISFLGAGLYEEVLFRLVALPSGQILFRILLVPRSLTMIASIVVTSLLFSAAHYLGPAADSFTLFSFVFRMLAGMFFAVLFVMRGFGITVGAHAGYDLIVGIVLKSA